MKSHQNAPLFCQVIAFLFLILHGSVPLYAQGKLIFSENFSDNHNNWLVSGKKAAISKEQGYLIDNTSKDNFISLQSIPLNAESDFHIILTMKSEWMDDYDSKYTVGEFGPGFRSCGVFFGAEDEHNGYSISLTNKGVLKIVKWENGIQKQLAYKSDATEASLYSEYQLDIVGENGRWKVLDVNIEAQPFMGNKIGVFVESKEKWQIHGLEYYEHEKDPGYRTTVFPADAFGVSLSTIMCEAKDKFANSLGEPFPNLTECYHYRNIIPGFTNAGVYARKSNEIKLSELGKDKFVELVAQSAPFDNEDAAMDYFEQARLAINAAKSDCDIPTALNNDIVKKGFEDSGLDVYQLWANFTYNPVSLLLVIDTEGGTDGVHPKQYIVEFHCIKTYQ